MNVPDTERENAIRDYIRDQPENWQGEDAAFLDNVYALLAELAAAREQRNEQADVLAQIILRCTTLNQAHKAARAALDGAGQ